MIGKSLGFALLPIHRYQVRALSGEVAVLGLALGYAYASLGLLPPEQWRAGLLATLRGAAAGWRAKWGEPLATGWRVGAREGLVSGVGGVVDAAWYGRAEIVRDTLAVAIGWLLLLTLVSGLGWALLSALVGTAHAAAKAAGGADADLARGMLVDLFPFMGGGTVLAQGLGKMAGVFGIFACALAALGVLWSAVVVVVEYNTNMESARQKYSWTMFALRAAVAVALATPLAGEWGAGQQLVGRLSAWGSDKASEAWAAAIDTLGDGKNWIAKPGVSHADAESVVIGTLRNEICMATFNADPRRDPPDANKGSRIELSSSAASLRYDHVKDGWFTSSTEVAGKCGKVEFPTGDDSALGGVEKAIRKVHREAYNTMRSKATKQVKVVVAGLWACKDAPTKCAKVDGSASVVQDLTAEYEKALSDGIAAQWRAANAATASNLAADAANGGWVAAGRWGLSLSKLQGRLAAVGAALPVVSPPIGGLERDLDDVLTSGYRWIGISIENAESTVTTKAGDSGGGVMALLGRLLEKATTGLWKGLVEIDQLQPLASISTVGVVLYSIGMVILGGAAVLASSSSMSWMKWAGHKVVEIASVPATEGASAGAVGAKWAAEFMGSDVVYQLMPFITAVSGTLIIVGMSLAYFVPALPFLRLLFAVVGWIIAVVEAVLLTPIFLVLLVTAEAGGFLGPLAKVGFYTIVSVVVRPILTVMGFVTSLMLLSVVVGLLNQMMLPYMRDFGNAGALPMIGPIAFIAYAAIYFFIIYGVVNAITKLPELVPAAAARWLGGADNGERDSGGALAGMSGAMMNRILGGTSRFGEKRRDGRGTS